MPKLKPLPSQKKIVTGNLVKDDPKAAARLSPTTGRYRYPENRPAPELIRAGKARRNARLRLQAHIESTLEEMLSNPTVRAADVEAIMMNFHSSSAIMDIVFNRYFKAITNPRTDMKLVKELSESLLRMGYGDKIDVTTNGRDMPTPIMGTINVLNEADDELGQIPVDDRVPIPAKIVKSKKKAKSTKKPKPIKK